MKKFIDFIKKIQNSDETTKKFWLIVFSSTVMVIIFGLWIINLKAGIPKVGFTSKEERIPAALSEKGGGNFKKVFLAGIKNIANNLKEKIIKSYQFSINKTDKNFLLEEMTEVPKTPLP